MKELSGKK